MVFVEHFEPLTSVFRKGRKRNLQVLPIQGRRHHGRHLSARRHGPWSSSGDIHILVCGSSGSRENHAAGHGLRKLPEAFGSNRNGGLPRVLGLGWHDARRRCSACAAVDDGPGRFCFSAAGFSNSSQRAMNRLFFFPSVGRILFLGSKKLFYHRETFMNLTYFFLDAQATRFCIVCKHP